jgi:ribose transport system substrate-binding protein
VSCGQESSGCASTTAQIISAVHAIGWKGTVCDGDFDVNNGYGNCITEGLAAHASGIILSAGFDCDLMVPQLRAAKAAHVPVVAAESIDCNDPLSSVQGPPLFTSLLMTAQYPNISQWMYARGEALAQYVIYRTGGHAQIIDLHFVGLLFGEYMHEGFLAGIKTCSGCKILAEVESNNATVASGKDAGILAAAVLAHPTANVIDYAFSSEVQSSQIQAAATKLGHSALVVGGEGQISSLDLIREGAPVPDAEVAYNGEQISWALVDTMNRIFAGQPPVPEGIGWVVVDKNHNLGQKGQYYIPPYNFTQIYLHSWGVGT